MERDLSHERTMDGLAAADAQGRYGGGPPAVADDTLAIARACQARGPGFPPRLVPVRGRSWAADKRSGGSGGSEWVQAYRA
ncbi:hypothetical protein [Streptosporangium sp. LJ11]|uniref:hypothetical protein n=1 Tax=Streptosporangium sp. LJ11 TaxID=3436927 RepID=UPI003F7B247C